MIVAKWGNSLAVRLPASVVQAMGLKEGDDIELQLAGVKRFVISRTSQKPSLAMRFAGLHQLLTELQETEALPGLPRRDRRNDFLTVLNAPDTDAV